MKDTEELSYDVEFMYCVVDKKDNMKVVDFDSHFSEFTGVHPSKIKQGKLHFHDILKPIDRETIFKKLCKKGFRYNYFDIELLDANKEPTYLHCMADNIENSTLCRITAVDISKSEKKQKELKKKTKEMNALIDMVTGGVCLFKVTNNMHIEALYLNKGCCKLFCTSKEDYNSRVYRIDELIHPEDKTVVFQAIGKSMATDDDIDLEIRIKAHKNEYSWVKLSAAIRNYDKDKTPIFHATFTDISKVKNAEEKADKESEKLVRIFKNLPGRIFCAASEENPMLLDYVSEDFISFLGYSRSELFEKYEGNLAKIVDGDSDEIVGKISAQIAEGESVYLTYNIKFKNGAVCKIADKRKIVKKEDGTYLTIGKYSLAD